MVLHTLCVILFPFLCHICYGGCFYLIIHWSISSQSILIGQAKVIQIPQCYMDQVVK